jgi:hypothetical protein
MATTRHIRLFLDGQPAGSIEIDINDLGAVNWTKVHAPNNPALFEWLMYLLDGRSARFPLVSRGHTLSSASQVDAIVDVLPGLKQLFPTASWVLPSFPSVETIPNNSVS